MAPRPLAQSDLIVVTPYNAQQVAVEAALAAAGFPDVPVGTTAWRVFFQPASNGQPLRQRTIGNAPRLGMLLDSWGADFVRSGDPPVTGPVEVRLRRLSPSGGSDAVSRDVA